ncbi:MAG: FeoB-associated Cys-rich membrane protein [Desulfobacteraceae bacterium]|nr:FeoB-associated Cys-rich membrane protein [Desulfobacteraceae bacterium]
METIIVLIIVALAMVYLVRRFYLNFKSGTDPVCGCGCSGCGMASDCTDKK